MQTHFSLAQLANADTAESAKILRSCVHCGICLSVCPTYNLLGDERDSPRGRIYMMKDSFENERPASALITTHLDRCLNCLACTDVCPSGVDYKHLIDHGRRYVENENPRSMVQKMLRALLALLVTHWRLFAFAMRTGRMLRPISNAMLGLWARLDRKNSTLLRQQLNALTALIPAKPAPQSPLARALSSQKAEIYPAQGLECARVVMLLGCAQQALDPEINAATLRVLQRLGCTVMIPTTPCCGSLRHHLGQESKAEQQARATIDAVQACGDYDGFVINASGCGATIKDYGHVLRHDPDYRDKAAALAAKTYDICEFIASLDSVALLDSLANPALEGIKVTYHASCSLQFGQKIKSAPKALLNRVGFDVNQPKDAHLCCGSAGVYNILQPLIAQQLAANKAKAILAKQPAWVCAGNLGCLSQLRQQPDWPQEVRVVHSIQLIDWATGGPRP